ncbi:hypothetical protein Tco_0818143 [Tanacetum coccineum]
MQNTVLNVHPTTSASISKTTSDLQQQLYFKMKSDLQAQVDDPELDDAFRKRDHDEYQGDVAPPEEQKIKETNTPASERQQQQQDWDAWVDDPVIDEDEVIPKDETLELINEF